MSNCHSADDAGDERPADSFLLRPARAIRLTCLDGDVGGIDARLLLVRKQISKVWRGVLVAQTP